MNNDHGILLAAACVKTIDALGGIATAKQVFDVVSLDEELYKQMPVTLATVSRSLRTLYRTRRAFIINERDVIKYTTTAPQRIAAHGVKHHGQTKEELRALAKPFKIVPNEPIKNALRVYNTPVIRELRENPETGRLESVPENTLQTAGVVGTEPSEGVKAFTNLVSGE